MEEFHKAQWHYYKKLGLNLAQHDNAYNNRVFAYEKDEPNKRDIYSQTDFLDIMRKSSSSHINSLGNREVSFDFFCTFYKQTNDENKKQLIKNFYKYSGEFIYLCFDKFCEAVYDNPQDKIKFLSSVSITDLSLKNLKVNLLHEYLKNIGLENDSLDKFYINFLKARKHQIKAPKIGSPIKQFLKNQYKGEKLEKFFPFFSLLKADYEEVLVPLFENKHNFSTISFLNIRNFAQKYGIENWDSHKYLIHIENLCKGLKSYYNLDSYAIKPDFNQPRKVEISFLHSNKDFDLTLLNSSILEFFEYLKENPIEPVPNESLGLTIIMHKNMNKNISLKEEKVQKIKI